MMKTRRIIILVLLVVCLVVINAFPVGAAELKHHGLYYIKNYGSGKFLNVTSTNNVEQYSKTYYENQRFFIDEVETVNGVTYYRISPDSNTSLHLDVDNALDADFTNIKVHVDSEAAAQQFRFIKVSDGYKIMPRLSTTRVLDVENASNLNNANIQLYSYRTETTDACYDYQTWILQGASTSIIDNCLVDSGKHLDWKSTSKYSGLITDAADIWNGYKSGVIRKKILLRSLEVTISDINIQSDFCAHTDFINDKIELNDFYMVNYTDNVNTNIIAHELGHALGMGHINSSSNVLGLAANETVVLRDSNKDSYDLAYSMY